MENSKGLLSSGEKTLCRFFIFLGMIVLAITFYRTPQRAWANILIDNFYFLSLSLSATVFIAALYLAKAGWAIGFRRISESMTAYLPYGAAIAIVSLFVGIKSLYFWASPPGSSDPIVMAKAIFLNWRALIAVSIVAVTLWLTLARSLVSNSRLQDEERDMIRTGKNRRLAAIFLILFALSYSLVAIYWVMSIEPLWYSTIYPWYVFAGMFVNGIAIMAMLLIWLKKKGFYQDIGPAHLHDVGKLLFAFSCFWAYLWISQYLIIWYENIPEEVTHYALRSMGPWSFVFWPNLIINFLLPFLILLGVSGKVNPRPLFLAALIVTLGHWIDLYLLVMPPLYKSGPIFGFQEFFIFTAFAALFILIFERAFRSAKPYPVGDPLLKESLALHE